MRTYLPSYLVWAAMGFISTEVVRGCSYDRGRFQHLLDRDGVVVNWNAGDSSVDLRRLPKSVTRSAEGLAGWGF